MTPEVALLVLAIGYFLPLLHVAFSPSAGPWRMPAGSRCPFSPRIGWLVIVSMLGPIGWLMFVTRKRRVKPADPSA